MRSLDNLQAGIDYCKEVICPSKKLEGDRIHDVNIHLSYHCNLNCESCAFFAPIADHKLPDKDVLTRDITRLAELTKDRPLDHILLMGGEPLLNPDVIYFINLVGRLFPNTMKYLYTNGLLLLDQKDEFWIALKENNVRLLITKYFSDEEFYDKIRKRGMEFAYEDVEFSLSSSKGILYLKNLLSEKDLNNCNEMWEICPFSNAQLSLNNGRLYSCHVPALCYHLDNKFGTSFSRTEDGVDIYTHSYDDIIAELKKPNATCQYCDRNCFKKLYFVDKSKCEKGEWIRDK